MSAELLKAVRRDFADSPCPWHKHDATPVTDCEPCAIGILLAALDEALSRLAAPERAGEGWQPIETAPKDGSDILIFADGIYAIAYWGGGAWPWRCALQKQITRPQLWMPLPSVPASLRQPPASEPERRG